MNVSRYTVLAVTSVAVLLIAACGSDEPTESPTSPATVTPSAATVDVVLKEWSVEPSPNSSAAGSVTFDATNEGTIEHELVVVKSDLAPDALVVVNGKVDEEASGTLIGEIEPDDLQPGQSSSATWDLEGGKYVLICNIAGHYSAGMYTGFTVN